MDMSQWEFYVMPTKVLDEKMGDQAAIYLSSLRELTEAVGYEGIRDAIDGAF